MRSSLRVKICQVSFYAAVAVSFSCIPKTMCQDGMLGPADLTLQRLEDCPEEYPYPLTVNRKKYNRTIELLSATLDYSQIDKDIMLGVYMNFAKFSDGGYKPNYYIIEEPDLCSFLIKHMEEGFKEFMSALSHPPECPFIPGFYDVKHFILDFGKVPKILLYGDFRIDALLTQNEKRLSCIRIFISSKAKMSFGK